MANESSFLGGGLTLAYMRRFRAGFTQTENGSGVWVAVTSLSSPQFASAGAYALTDPTGMNTFTNADDFGSAVLDDEVCLAYTAAPVKGAHVNAVCVPVGANKIGFKLASDGLDSISITAPTGVASNFREMSVQLWRRFFKKTTKTSTQIKTYADNGTTVITTQTISDTGSNQTQGAAT
jgi:hypothetical protein